MPRPPRIEIPGVPLHIVQRGNNRNACFFGDTDRRFYLKCLSELARLRNCAVHAYALMTNHVHLLLTPGLPGAVSALLQDLGRHYVRTVNDAHDRTGTLWEGRFKSNLIDSERYLLTCHRYIELNPVRAGIVADPADYPWSSHLYYSTGKPSSLISEHSVYQRLGSDSESRRKAFVALFDHPIGDIELNKLRTAVNKGWALGSEQFVDQMESIAGRTVRPTKRGRPRKESNHDENESSAQPELLL